MSDLNELFDKYKVNQYEDLPHPRKKLSKYFSRSWMDCVLPDRTVVSKRH